MDAKTKRQIMSLISEQARSMIHDILFEQTPNTDPPAEAPAPDSAEPVPVDSASVGDTGGDMSADTGGDMGGDMGAADGMNTPDQGMTSDTQGMSTDAGGGFGGLDGVGGGPGGSGDDGMGGTEGDSGESGATSNGDDMSPESNPADPVGEVMQTAEELVAQTDNVPMLTKALKASIQVNFQNYADAWPIVQKLKNSDNESLRAVSRRLALFIAGA